MPIDVPEIIWQDGAGFKRRLSLASNLFRGVLAQSSDDRSATINVDVFLQLDRASGAGVSILLAPHEAFYDTFDGRTQNYGDLQSVLANQKHELSPVVELPHVIFAQKSSQTPNFVELLFVQSTLLERLEEKAGKLGVQKLELIPSDNSSLSFLSPTSLKQQQTAEGFWWGAMLAILFSFWATANLVSARFDEQLADLQSQESELRTLATERSARDRQVSALQTLAVRGVDGQTVEARLSFLDNVRSATPNDSWWLGISISGDEAEVSGMAGNAAKVLQSLSNAYSDREVIFSQRIIDEGDNQQSYVISIGAVQ